MSTQGSVAFAALIALLLAVVAFLGLTTVSAGMGVAITAGAATLIGISWQTTGAEAARRGERDREAMLMSLATIALVSVGSALLVRRAGLAEIGGSYLWPWRGLAITAAAVVTAFYGSSLIDWCYVVPHLKGAFGASHLPCQSSTEQEWRTLTRLWLLHRIVAYVVGRLGALVALGFLVASFHPNLSSSAASASATLVAAIAIFYLNRVIPIGALVTNPPIQVGDKVVLAEEFGTGVAQRPVYYVVDVSIEGVQMLELGHADRPLGSDFGRSHDRSLSLGDVARLLRARQRFEGCTQQCCAASKYCPLKLGDPTAHPCAEGADLKVTT